MANLLETLAVIRIHDARIKPPGPKMVVCVWPGAGLFYRFNTYDEYPISILIPKQPNHPFLDWDSYLEVGKAPIQFDDYSIGKAIQSCGGAPLGALHHSHVPDICAAIAAQETLSAKLLNAIVTTLNRAVPKPVPISAAHSDLDSPASTAE